MNENFSLQSSLEANYLNIHLDEPVQLDKIAVNVIKEDCPEFIIPFRIVNINDSISLKYKLINTIALEYINMTLNKSEFVKLYMNLLTPFIKGKEWFLDYHNFCIDTRYIFLDKMSDASYFIYVPERTYSNTDLQILDFFKTVFTKMTITDDAGFQVRLYKYFSRNDVTLADLYNLFLEESRHITASASVQGQQKQPQQTNVQPQQPRTVAGQQPAQIAQSQPVNPQTIVSQSDPGPAASAGKKKSGGLAGVFGGGDKEKVSVQESDDEVMKALFGDSKKKGKNKKTETTAESSQDKKAAGFSFFGKKKEGNPAKNAVVSAPQQTAPIPQPVVQPVEIQQSAASAEFGFAQMQDSGDRTEIYSEDFQVMSAYLDLIDSPIPGAIPRIDLNFSTPYITIGRISSDEIQPDVAFSREFSRIGRRHARIEKRDGVYYIIDLGSANHTLLNGRPLVPNQPYKLPDGGELTFTDSKPVRYRINL